MNCPSFIVCISVQHDMLLKLQGAYNEKQVISASKNSSLMQTLRYYINKNLGTELGLWMVQFVLHVHCLKNCYKKIILNRLYIALTEQMRRIIFNQKSTEEEPVLKSNQF